MDWVDPLSSEPTEEREDDMSSLAARFAARMCKQARSAQMETTSGSEGPNSKRPKRTDPDKVVQKIPVVVTLDSPK